MSTDNNEGNTNNQADNAATSNDSGSPVGDNHGSGEGEGHQHDVHEPAKATGDKVDAAEYESLRKKFYELSAENKKYRQKANASSKEALEAKKAAEDAKKSTDQLKSIADQRIIRAELKTIAVKEGLIDLEDACKLVDMSSIKVSEGGDVLGAAEMITNLKTTKPYLFKSNNSSQTDYQAPPSSAAISKENAMDLSDEDYMKKNPKSWRKHHTILPAS
jgi:hypothetical protein